MMKHLAWSKNNAGREIEILVHKPSEPTPFDPWAPSLCFVPSRKEKREKKNEKAAPSLP